MGPPGRLDTDFIFQYFKSRYLVFLKDEFYQFHSSWSWDIQRQLFKSFHWTFLCSPLNAMLISEIEPFYDFELKILFCTFKGLQFTRNFHLWNICVYKDKSSVLNEPHLQLPFLLLLQIIAIFPDYENNIIHNIYFLSCFVPWYSHLGAYFMIMLLLCESNRKVVPLSETFNHKLTKF